MNSTLSQWHPFRELSEMQKRLAAAWGLEPARSDKQESLAVSDWSPRVDITEDDREFVVKAELPEVKKEDVKITVEDGTLAIYGERKFEKEERNKKHHRIEREYGTFLRSFVLPAGTLPEKVTAEFKDGVLRVHLPKEAKAPSTKSIEIKTT